MEKAAAKSTTPRRKARARNAIGDRGAVRRNDAPRKGGDALSRRELLAGLRAMHRGEFDVRLPDDLSGVDGQICETFNELTQFARTMRDDVVALRKSVGIEGRTHRRLARNTARGGWADYASGVNEMLDDVTAHTTDVARVLSAVAKGDLGQTIDIAGTDAPLRGDFLRHARLVNGMVSQLAAFSSEVTRVAQEVGVDGKLGAQARIRGVSGVWKELTDSVNLMASNLTNQVREIAQVTTAVAQGDLTKTVNIEARGEILELKNTINTMVQQLGSFASEVTRVAREVGTEGILGGQAHVRGVSGVWRELTRNVNSMANNLTTQVRNIAEVATAIAAGDLSRKITVDVRGEVLEVKRTINTMVDQLGAFAAEVTRVAREVGTEGVLGGQAKVAAVSGVWRELTENVNGMAGNLTSQVRNIAEVITAIAQGDLGHKIAVDARGEILTLKETINATVDKLNRFAAEVNRMARLVGTEGTLGVQADVKDVSGVWKELTANVNQMGRNLTDQVRDIAMVTTAVARGDLTRKIMVDAQGEILELKNTINTMVDQLSAFADQVTRLATEVGTEGKLGGQADVRGVAGTWRHLTDAVNSMANNLTEQVRNISQVATAIAQGDLQKKIVVDARGEILELKNTINIMVDQLNGFAAEVTRVAREVGTEGVLGGQAEVRGVSGVWRGLTDNVNVMARNLTEQVRGIARVVTAVANGDLDQKLTLEAKGELATLVETINAMIVTLSTFADQVIGVAREVGVEGRLGGQADVPGAAGVWRDLTNNVNELAGNLTRQVRAIGDVATAVTKGDLTQSITVDARGEVALLKDNMNQMIRTLADTTLVNQEQDWLKTNLARFTRMLQGQRDLLTVAEHVLNELTALVNAQHGSFFMAEAEEGGGSRLRLFASYAYRERTTVPKIFSIGEGLVGQAAREKKRLLITDVPTDYVRINSSLGEATPLNIVIVPISFEGEIKGVLELASFQAFTPIQIAFLEQLVDSLGIVVATIEATMKTDDLLRKSQSMAEELQSQQEELQQTNEELEEKARQLTAQKTEVERKNRDVEIAKQELEEKAEQLALTSRYKSQFLANMSHELRTPLNSLLILSRQLEDNREKNLTARQIEFATTIRQSGADLLALINEILDLAKIESGTMAVDLSLVPFVDIREFVDRSFRHVAEEKGLGFAVELDPALPPAIRTDDMRLRQVLRNLLSNALKFTDKGVVTLRIFRAVRPEWAVDNQTLNGAGTVVAFSVQDTGIGIPTDKQKSVFEAFQQADGGTSRKYGGTGLGLAISREIAGLLGGELHLHSQPGVGSVLTLFVPLENVPRAGSSMPLRALEERGKRSGGTEASETAPSLQIPAVTSRDFSDDRHAIRSGDRVLLMIEDDETFGRALLGFARERGFRGVVTSTGGQGLEMARVLRPDAITLDLRLPDMDGWVLLDQLKHDPLTRHIPVHVITASDEERRSLDAGAIAYLRKPADREALNEALGSIHRFLERRVRRLLVVEDDEVQRRSIVELIGNGDVVTDAVGSAEEALAALEAEPFDCVVLDLRLPGMSGLDLMTAIRDRPAFRRLPTIVYTGKELSRDEEAELRQLSETIIVKDVRSPERLLDETALFLHRVEANLPDPKREILRRLTESDPALAGKKVLLVDDDARNLFAITTILEQHEMKVVYGENGQQALDKLAANPDIDIVLMDIMMPEMDGYEATRRIRSEAGYAKLPIIALTAKAMKGDREKCIEAGASDYITKPIDANQLVSLLRVWLYA